MNEKQKAVYEIQDYLRNISFYDSSITFVVSDGIFGQETTDAVRLFQAQQGLEDNGIVDFETWKRLVEVSAFASETLAQPFRIAPIEQKDLPLKKGDSNIFVQHLNLMLSRLARDFSNFAEPENYDVFDSATEKQIRRWQRITALTETGQVDKSTWNLLASYYLL